MNPKGMGVDARPGRYLPPSDDANLHTIYDLLRRLVNGGAWDEDERREASELINELERNAIFGNRASEITMKEE